MNATPPVLDLPQLTVTVSKPVYLVNHAYTSPVLCGRGPHHVGGRLQVAGETVVYRCRCGHTQRDTRLGGAHVRLAVSRARVSRGRVRHPLLVTWAELPPETDPVELHSRNREAWLPPVGRVRTRLWASRSSGLLYLLTRSWHELQERVAGPLRNR